MREIKFRVIQLISKRIIGYDYLHESSQRWMRYYVNAKGEIQDKGSCFGCCIETDVIRKQYTGLKDKNGVEIYEGDILNCGCNAVVKFIDGKFQPYYDGGNQEAMEDDFCLFNNEIEVIGNIYQNPELLEGGK